MLKPMWNCCSPKRWWSRQFWRPGLTRPVLAAGTGDWNYLTWRLFRGDTVQAYAPRPGDLQALFANLAVPGNGLRRFQHRDRERWQI